MPLQLRPDEIHLWWASVPSEGADLATDLELLSDGERRRAQRFKIEHPRRCHIAAHAFLRSVLAGYCGAPASTIEFSFGERGKPFLTGDAASPFFNLSHSGDVIVLAVSAAVELGVDVEILRTMPRAEALAKRFFTAAEGAHVAALSGAEQHAAFFHLWTAKEAYLKAIGTGLSTPLREVEISQVSETPPRIVSIGGDATAAAGWNLLRPPGPEGTICTIAIRGDGWRVVDRGSPR